MQKRFWNEFGNGYGGFRLEGWEFMQAAITWAKKHPEVRIANINDGHYKSAILMGIPTGKTSWMIVLIQQDLPAREFHISSLGRMQEELSFIGFLQAA